MDLIGGGQGPSSKKNVDVPLPPSAPSTSPIKKAPAPSPSKDGTAPAASAQIASVGTRVARFSSSGPRVLTADAEIIGSSPTFPLGESTPSFYNYARSSRCK